MKINLEEKLLKYNKQKYIPMHMPGHKRNTKLLGDNFPYAIDITEIDGFDNLHDAKGCIKDICDYASKVYRCKKSFVLVNGSTCGILATIKALTKCGDEIVVARNCHKSVYNAIELCKLVPTYIYPKIDDNGIAQQIKAEQVEKALNKAKNAKLVIITSPTYEGIISNIEEISKVVHKHNALLFVDEAHGAHLYFSKKFGGGAIGLGADVVVNSLHKTLPALTQCALLNICSDQVNETEIANALAIFETSSPSYILLSSISNCLHFVNKNKNKLFNELNYNLCEFEKNIKKLKVLKVFGYANCEYESGYLFDKSKIVVLTNQSNITGVELANILRKKYKIEIEMSCKNYIVAISSICDTYENLMCFANALIEIDKKLKLNALKSEFCQFELKAKHQIYESDFVKKQQVAFANSEGEVAEEYVFVYPPGIPLIVKGEQISKDIIDYILDLKNSGLEIKSTFSDVPNNIYVKNS